MEPQPRCLQTRASFQPASNTSTVFNRVFFATCIIFCKPFLRSPLRWQGKCSRRVRKKWLFLNSPCLSALSAQVADGEATFAAPGVPQRVVWPLPGDGGTDVGTVPSHAARGGGPARSSPARLTSTPKPCSGCCAAGTHRSHQISDITTSVPLQTPMKSSSQLQGFGLPPHPFAGNAKGLQSRHQTRADGTVRDLGPSEDPRGLELCMGHREELWVTADAVSEQQRAPGGSCQSRGCGKSPGTLCSSNTDGNFWPGPGFAVMKSFQCPQGEKEKKKERK